MLFPSAFTYSGYSYLHAVSHVKARRLYPEKRGSAPSRYARLNSLHMAAINATLRLTVGCRSSVVAIVEDEAPELLWRACSPEHTCAKGFKFGPRYSKDVETSLHPPHVSLSCRLVTVQQRMANSALDLRGCKVVCSANVCQQSNLGHCLLLRDPGIVENSPRTRLTGRTKRIRLCQAPGLHSHSLFAPRNRSFLTTSRV